MREILFRAKTVCDGDWIYGGITWNPSKKKVFIHTEWDEGEVIPETVGQYTGLKDKNGKKVFEGDILKGLYSNGNAEVKMINGSWVGYAGKGWTDIGYVVDRVEVIGNIHDNPELLQD